MLSIKRQNIVNFKHRIGETIYYIRGKNLVEAKVTGVIMKMHNAYPGIYRECCELDNGEKIDIVNGYGGEGTKTFHTKEGAKRSILGQCWRNAEMGFVGEKVEIKYPPGSYIYNVEGLEVKKNRIVSCTIALYEETQKLITYESKNNPSFFEKLLGLTQVEKIDIQKSIGLNISYSTYGGNRTMDNVPYGGAYLNDPGSILYKDGVYSLGGEYPGIFYYYGCASEKLKELVDKL